MRQSCGQSNPALSLHRSIVSMSSIISPAPRRSASRAQHSTASRASYGVLAVAAAREGPAKGRRLPHLASMATNSPPGCRALTRVVVIIAGFGERGGVEADLVSPASKTAAAASVSY